MISKIEYPNEASCIYLELLEEPDGSRNRISYIFVDEERNSTIGLQPILPEEESKMKSKIGDEESKSDTNDYFDCKGNFSNPICSEQDFDEIRDEHYLMTEIEY